MKAHLHLAGHRTHSVIDQHDPALDNLGRLVDRLVRLDQDRGSSRDHGLQRQRIFYPAHLGLETVASAGRVRNLEGDVNTPLDPCQPIEKLRHNPLSIEEPDDGPPGYGIACLGVEGRQGQCRASAGVNLLGRYEYRRIFSRDLPEGPQAQKKGGDCRELKARSLGHFVYSFCRKPMMYPGFLSFNCPDSGGPHTHLHPVAATQAASPHKY